MKWNEVRKHFGMLSKRAMAGVIATAMVGTSLAGCSAASEEPANANVEMTKERTEESSKSADAEDGVMSALLDTVQENTNQSNEEQGKEETVYIFADSEGNMTSTVVSGWLKNPEGLDVLTDLTDASDVFNVKGDETFTKDGNEYRWEANGSDIYYQGTTAKEAPVTEKITYYLDGKEISAKELAGKSGKVRIRFDYENTQTTTAQVNGREEEIAVPFAVVTGMILNDRFRNISVENGRLVSDGKNNMVIGFALPGLKESLKLDDIDLEDSDEEIRVPDYVEVSADVEDFALDMTLTVAASSADLSFDKTLDFSDLDEKIDTLTDSSAQLADGTEELNDGIQTLKDSLGEFSDGVASLKDGIVEYTDGAGRLADGISEVKDGADSLDSGAGALVDGVNALQDGANALKDGIDSAASGAKELKDGIDSAKSGAGELKSGIDSAASGAKELKDGIASANSGAKDLKDGITAAVSGAEAVNAGIGAAKQGAEQLAQGINGDTGAKNGAAQLKDGLGQLKAGIEGNGTAENPGLQAASESIVTGINSLADAVGNPEDLQSEISSLLGKEIYCVNEIYAAAGRSDRVTAETVSDVVKNDLQGIVTGAIAMIEKDAANAVEELLAAAQRTEQKAADEAYLEGYAKGREDWKEKNPEAVNEDKAAEKSDAEGGDGENPEESADNAGAAGSGADNSAGGNAGAGDEGEGSEESDGVQDVPADGGSSEEGGNGGAADMNAEQSQEPEAEAIAAAYSVKRTQREGKNTTVFNNGDDQKYEAVALANGEAETDQNPGTSVESIFGTAAEKISTITVLYGNAKQLDQAVDDLRQLQKLSAGIQNLQSGIGKLAVSIANIPGAIDQLYDGAVQLSQGMEILGSGAADLGNGMDALSQGSSELTAGMDKLADGSSALTFGMGALADGSSALTDGMGQLSKGSSELTEGMDKLAGGGSALTDGMGKLKDGSSELADGTKELQSGSYELKDGTQKLKDGAVELQDGAKELTDNSGALVDGADELADGTLQVVDGVDELYEGAGKLLDGMLEFDGEGIQKIADAYNGDVKALTDRVKAISDAGSSYDNFCGKADDTKSSVKFIIRTEPVK